MGRPVLVSAHSVAPSNTLSPSTLADDQGLPPVPRPEGAAGEQWEGNPPATASERAVAAGDGYNQWGLGAH